MMETRVFESDANWLHNRLTVVDSHCDTIVQISRGRQTLNRLSETGHVDIVRLREGGVSIQFFACFIESVYKPFSSLTRALQLIDTFYKELDLCDGLMVLGISGKQIRKELRSGKIIAVLGIEGGEALNGDISVLRVLHRLGVRFIGLTWNQRNQLADGVSEGVTGGGLSNFGREVIREMNLLGMLVDLSHISEAGFWDVLGLSSYPVIVSHANCRRLCNHPRNLTDEQIKGLAKKNGVIGLTFVPEFLGSGQVCLEEFLNHVDHVAGLVGTDIIAIGSDFDGIDETPKGLEDCRCFPKITAGLLNRGYTEKEIRGIMGENMLRVIEQVMI